MYDLQQSVHNSTAYITNIDYYFFAIFFLRFAPCHTYNGNMHANSPSFETFNVKYYDMQPTGSGFGLMDVRDAAEQWTHFAVYCRKGLFTNA